MKLLSILIVTLLHLKMLAQIDYKVKVMGTTNNFKINTPHYTDLSDQLLVKLTTNFKYTTFEIVDKNTKKMAQFYPNGNFDLGIDVSYKWAGLGISYGLPNQIHQLIKEAQQNDLIYNLIYTPKLLLLMHFYNAMKAFICITPKILQNGILRFRRNPPI